MNSTCHVLIVEDDPPIRKLLHRQLASLGCQVDVAADGREGLSLWECNEYDLVFTDVSMPGMNGFELASSIRASGHRKAQLIPVIAVTGHAEDRKRCAAAGVTDCLGKPFSTIDLQRVLDRWVPGVRVGVLQKPQAANAGDGAPGVAAPDLSGDPAIMRSIALTFIQTVPEYIQSLDGACAARSRQGIVAAVHKLKSAARLVGGDMVADLCEAVEGASQDSDTARIVQLAKPIPDAVKALDRSLKRVLASGAPNPRPS